MDVTLNANLKVEISDSETIQIFHDALLKISNRKFCIGFGVPKLTDEENDLINQILEKVREYGFQNPELEKLINKPKKD